MRVKLDEASLKKIAEITKAEYFSADNRQELLQIYQSLSSKIVLKKHRRTEVSALCALLGMQLLGLVASRAHHLNPPMGGQTPRSRFTVRS